MTSPSTLAALAIAAARQIADVENESLAAATLPIDSREIAAVAGVSRVMIYKWRLGERRLSPVRLRMIREWFKSAYPTVAARCR